MTFLGLTGLLSVQASTAGIRGNNNDNKNVIDNRRRLQDCPCDCTDEMGDDVEEAVVIQGVIGTTFCVSTSAIAELLVSFPLITCAGEDDEEEECPDNFITINPILGGGGDGFLDDFLAFDDTLQFDDFLGGGLDDILGGGLGDILPFGDAP